jgi:hypothetical protein
MPKSQFASIGDLGSFKDFAMGEMKFPEMKIGELAAKAEEWGAKAAEKIGTREELQNLAPLAKSVEQVAGQVAEFAEKNWPKAPIKVPPSSGLPPALPKSPLPPLKRKNPLPPPIRPRADFRRD